MKAQNLFLYSLTLMFSAECSINEDTIEDFHIRKGFLNLGNGPREYKFNNVSASTGFITSFPWAAIQTRVSKDILNSTDIQYWIYTSVETAELEMVERLDMSSLYMNNVIDSPLPQGPIGDNCWYQKTVSSIQFIRNNVLISITLNINNSSFDYSTVEWLAREIDLSITESKKINNANLIPAPVILSFDIVSTLPNNWGQSVEIKVNASDPNSRNLTFREVATGFALTNNNGTFNIKLDQSFPIYITEDLNKFRIMIWIWNEDHLVSLAEKEFSFQKF
jgi:hypothetical protein